MSKVLIVTGGHVSTKLLRKIYEQGHYDLVFGVDHGMDYLMDAGISPNVVLGDFDSCEEDALSSYHSMGIEVLEFPPMKDMTDTHLAIEVAVERGGSHVTLLGAFGSRLDHSLANVFSLAAYSEATYIELIDEHNKLYYTRKPCELIYEGYKYISLVPLTYQVKGVTFTGVKYPLKAATLKMMDSYGVSNEFLGDRARLEIEEGLLLVIQSRD